jgi:phosphoglycolate phosphatase
MMVLKYRHIIWDWNGTLFDDAWLCLQIINRLLSERGLQTITPDQYEQSFGFPVIDYYQRIGFNFAIEPFERINSAFISDYERRRVECSLRTGAKMTIDNICRVGISQSILSASKQVYLEKAVHQFGIRNHFVSISGLDNHHAAGKLEIALNWMNKTEINPREILLIGDTIHDYEVAERIGAACILIYSGHQDVDRLATCGVRIIRYFSELSKILPL